jgi:hypothetical protein
MIAVQHLEPGVRLRLKGGRIVEVVENPRDGMWLVVRALPPDGRAEDSTELVHAEEVVEQAG